MAKEKKDPNLERILEVADKSYPDGCIARIHKGDKVDDGLARFIVNEIKSVYEGGNFDREKEGACRALEVAVDELYAVINALRSAK